AITLAAGLNLPAKPFILAVMFAANFSFFTPMGYQTNTLIYGTGAYKFRHFLIIGGWLSIILLVVGTLLLSTLLNGFQFQPVISFILRDTKTRGSKVRYSVELSNKAESATLL